uniref:Uncharacterized protein n=1 Tax=Globodera rostochiensis TaxID=31243 RepID=A0A914H7N9_GLORO
MTSKRVPFAEEQNVSSSSMENRVKRRRIETEDEEVDDGGEMAETSIKLTGKKHALDSDTQFPRFNFSSAHSIMRSVEKDRTNFCLPLGCPLGSRCPFKENAVQAWHITKDLADQRDEMFRLNNEIVQLKNINSENKEYIESLRAAEQILKQNIEQQQEKLLQKDQEIVVLRLQIGQITKAARAQQTIHPATVQSTSSEATIKLTKQFSSIFKAIFFDELSKQLLIEDITGLVILEKQQQKQQQFSIDDELVKKIIKQEKAPKLAILRISKKFGVLKSQATLLFTESKRKSATELQAKAFGKRKREPSDGEDDDNGGLNKLNKARFPSKQKCQNPKALMPWRPYRKVLPPDVRNSVLSSEDHRNYVAILQNMLKSEPTFRFEHDMKKIKAWDEMLKDERQLYVDIALRTIKSWKTYPNSLFVYPEAPSLNSVMNHQIMKSRYVIGERAFQGVQLEIPWTTNVQQQQQQSVAFRLNVSVLRPGHGKSLNIPDTRQRFMLKLNHKDIEKKISAKLEQKLPITADNDLRNFAIQNDIEFVMDGSTLCHLLSAPYGHKPQISYACRVSVQLEFRGGKMRRVCSVFPPIIASRMHRPFVAREYFKWAIKLALRKNREQKTDDEIGQKKKFKTDESSAESLLNELQLGQIGKTASGGSSSSADVVGKRYAIVTFDGGDQQQQSEFDQQHRVLIRTGVHGTEDGDGTRDVVSLAVRPEFLPELAAEKISPEETLMDVVTATLKGLARRAVNCFLRECSGCALFLMPLENFVRERNVVSQSNKERGDDSDNESDELNLYIEDERGEENAERSDALSSGPVYDFAWFEHVAKMKPVFSHAPIEDYWNGIDPHYPLQWHICSMPTAPSVIAHRQHQQQQN